MQQPGLPAEPTRRPRRSLGGLLLALTVGTLLPVLLFSSVVSWLSAERERRIFEDGARERTRAILTAIDAEVKGSITTLEALATARALDDGDFAAFQAESVRVLKSQADWLTINLALPSGQQLTNSLRPYGEPLTMVRDRDSLQMVLRTGKPAVGSMVIGAVVTEYNIPVRVPVMRGGTLRYVLTAAVTPRSFQALLVKQGLPSSWIGGVLDRNSRFIARTASYDEFLGKQAGGPQFLADIAQSSDGVYHGINLAGNRVYSPFVRSAFTGWVVAIGIPAEFVEGAARRATLLMLVGTLAALALAFLFAQILARRIAGPIGDLAGAARSLAEGGVPTVPRLPDVREFVDLGNAFIQAGATLAARDEAQGRFAAVANNATVAIFLTDLRQKCVFLNPAAERMTGWGTDEAKDHWLREVIGAPEHEHQPGVVEALGVVLAAAQPRAGEDSFTSRAGRRFPVAFAISPIQQSGVVTGAIVEARDITETKRVESVRAELLESQMRARREAEAANQAKDEFLAMLGHELRNPLGAISNASYLLGVAKNSGEHVDAARTVISRQVTHVSRLVDDLLDVARVTTGKIALTRAPVDLAEVARGAIETLTAAGKAADRKLTADLAETWVDGDRTRLDQVVINLVGNALRYTPAGGEVSVELGRDDGHAVLTVRDNGIGIPPSALEKIFDLFYQGEHGIDRTQGGLGIGLTLVRRLVELHGGSVSVVSGGSGKGSAFTVRLPALQRGLPAAHAPGEDTADSPHLRILLIEDNQDARETMAAVLGGYGHEIFEAADGISGLEAARRVLPDLALVDIGLPGISGYEVASALRADPATRGMRLIALTGYGQPEDAARALAAGFDLHLTKPADIDRLLAVIDGGERVV